MFFLSEERVTCRWCFRWLLNGGFHSFIRLRWRHGRAGICWKLSSCFLCILGRRCGCIRWLQEEGWSICILSKLIPPRFSWWTAQILNSGAMYLHLFPRYSISPSIPLHCLDHSSPLLFHTYFPHIIGQAHISSSLSISPEQSPSLLFYWYVSLHNVCCTLFKVGRCCHFRSACGQYRPKTRSIIDIQWKNAI